MLPTAIDGPIAGKGEDRLALIEDPTAHGAADANVGWPRSATCARAPTLQSVRV